MQIAIAVITLLICGGVLYWFKRTEAQKRQRRSEEEDDERIKAAQKTAQEFVNAKDLGSNCLYTTDGYIFAYIKIEGLNLELYSRQEQKLICRELSAAQEIVKKYTDNGIHAELLDKKGIVHLLNLVNNPAYVHIENTNIEDVISVLSDS